MKLIHPHARQYIRQVAFRATQPSEFEATLIVDGDGQPKQPATQGWLDPLTMAALAWLFVALAMVGAAVIIAGITASDVIGWLADAADTVMRHASAAGASLALAPIVRTDTHRIECYCAQGDPLHEFGHRLVELALAAAAGLLVGMWIGGAL